MNKPIFQTGHQMGQYSPVFIFILLSFYPFVGIGLIVLGGYSAYTAIVYDGYSPCVTLILCSFIWIIALFFLILGWVTISDGLSQYWFEEKGLRVKYPLRSAFLIPWDDFQEVCIIFAAYTTRGERRANSVICCIKKGEKKNSRGRWKTDNPFRYRSVISIAYTPYLHEGIKVMYPYQLFDYRERPEYKLN